MGAASRQPPPPPFWVRPCLIATLILRNSKMRQSTGSMGTSGKGKLFRNPHPFFLSSKMILVRNGFERRREYLCPQQKLC
jgi:hypothetical protein